MHLIALPQLRTPGIVTPQEMYYLLHKARRPEVMIVLSMLSDIYNGKSFRVP